MIPILSTLLLTVADMRNEISALSSSLVALDAHTHSLPSSFQVQEAVQVGATVPLSGSLRDLSYRLAGAVPTHTTLLSSGQSAGRTAQPTPAKSAQPPRLQPPQANLPKQGMDRDVLRYDPSGKIFYRNPQAYAFKFPDSWKAKAFREGKYPPVNTFVPSHTDPLWSGPPSNRPSRAQILRVSCHRPRWSRKEGEEEVPSRRSPTSRGFE